jgi:DtxR family Mn-dependent transcriptional regulator
MKEPARTEAVEDYLKAIYLLESAGQAATTVALAVHLEVSAPSVTGMLKKLASLKLVRHAPYHGVTLTTAGRKIALEVIRHHRLLERYLAEALGYPWERVHAEAERLEHHISEEFEDRIAALLGHPETDPHGDPIPAKDGTLPAQAGLRLTEARAGEAVVIERVAAQDAGQLNYLGSLGLRPAVAVTFLGQAPYDGPVHLRVGEAELHVGVNLARQIYVRRVAAPAPAPA